jgi:hypothetical protein
MAKTLNPHQQHLSLTHGTPGTVYVLHFEPAYKHALHYIGWTSEHDVNARITVTCEAADPHSYALRSTPVSRSNSQGPTPGTRYLERRLKRRHKTRQLCTICRQQH